MTATKHDSTVALEVIDACVAHGRQLLASQLPDVESRNYDFMPSFKEMTIQLYLVGIMWRFGEQFDLPVGARERGFICLMSMLVAEGMSLDKAQNRVAHLNEISRTSSGQDNLVIAAGYGAQSADGSLVAVFDAFRGVPEVSGAPYRLLDRSKPIAAILVVAGFLVSLLIGRSLGEAFGVGVVLGVAALAIALVMHRRKIK